MQENRIVCLGCTRPDFSEVLTFLSIFPLTVQRVLLLVIHQLVLPALLQDGYRKGAGVEKKGQLVLLGETPYKEL